LDKVDFKLTLIKWDKGHSILIKGEIHQQEITIINIYASNLSARTTKSNFIKHTFKDLKAHLDSNTVVVRHFNISLSPIDRLSKQKNQ
jgi:hypothetical protein